MPAHDQSLGRLATGAYQSNAATWRQGGDAIQISGFAIPFSGSRHPAITLSEQTLVIEGHAVAHHVIGRAR